MNQSQNPYRPSAVYYASGDRSPLTPSRQVIVEGDEPRYRSYALDSRNTDKYYADLRVRPQAAPGEAPPPLVALGVANVLVEPGSAAQSARHVVQLVANGVENVRVEGVEQADVDRVRMMLDMAASREEVSREQLERVEFVPVPPKAAPVPEPPPPAPPAHAELLEPTIPVAPGPGPEEVEAVDGPESAYDEGD